MYQQPSENYSLQIPWWVISSKENWEMISNFIHKVMKKKEDEALRR